MPKKAIQKVKVSADSQLHLSTTYPRTRGKEKRKPKRVFNFVLTGLLISSTLMGSVFTGQEDVFASKGGDISPSSVTQTVQVNPYQDELAMISNLKMASRVLTQGIESGELTPAMYQKVLNSLTTIEAKLDSGSEFGNVVDLSPVLHDTGSALVQDVQGLSVDGEAYRDASIGALQGVYTKLGLETPVFEVIEADASADVLGVAVTNRVYKDLNMKYVSHKNIKWALDRGYLNAYVNTTHPAKRVAGKGNWADFQSNIRERDMLATVFRYARSSEYGKLKVANKKNSHSKEYQLASKYGVKTRATVTNTAKSSQAVTRIEFARALSYAHYGKKVTDAQAIKFMYTANVTQGNKVNNKFPKTTASFGSNVVVTRADVALGVKAYDNYKVALAKKSQATQPAKPPVTQPTQPAKPPATTTPSKTIKTQYGSHTYGVDSQAEYDAVMKLVRDEFNKSFNSKEFDVHPDIYRVLNGERGTTNRSDPKFLSPENVGLLDAEIAARPLLEGRISLDTYKQIYRANAFFSHLMRVSGTKNVVGNKNVKSAHDALIKKTTDCDATAHVQSIVYDMVGIDNAVIGDGVTHAMIVLKVKEGWMDAGTSPFTKEQINQVNRDNIYLSYTQSGAKIQ